MKSFRRSLPPLDSLVFFEASARHNSFTASAGELGVTQAAVSKRIAELERWLGTALFLREGRKLSLTETGRKLHERTVTALDFLDDACRSATDFEPTEVRVAANSAISLFWLGSKLRRFGLSPDAVPVTVRTTDRLGEQLDSGNDLAILFGHGDTPGWQADLLFADELVPVAHPDYLNRIGLNGIGAANLAEIGTDPALCIGITLLEYDRIAPDWVNWKSWMERVGATGLRASTIRRFGSYAQSVGAAIDGHGLALGGPDLLGDDLAAGRLVVVPGLRLVTGRGYFLCYPRGRILPHAVTALRASLLSG